jgi:outer membrane protein assembly factor BamB
VTLKPESARDSDEFGGGLSWYGGRLFVTTGFAQVFSLEAATGKEIWTSHTSAPVRGAPLVFGDRVVVVAIDNKLQAFAAVDGADLWSFSGLNEGTSYLDSASPAGSGEFVVAPFSSGELASVRLTNGRMVWNEQLVGSRRDTRAFGALSDIRGRPVIDRGLVVAMGSSGTIAAFELTSGQHKWERSIGGSQTPWVAGRFVFVVSNSADVIALSRDDGKVKWVTPLTQYFDDKGQRPIGWAGPVLASDRLLVAGQTGELIAISPYDGSILGKMDMKSPIRLAPIIANRMIYVLTDSGRLIALR